MPLISVIVPVYNVEDYLRECVDSILNQTFRDFELILVDDGSKDNCPSICDEYVKKDERVVVIHKKNGGLSSARNTGLDIHKGEFVSFIDSDDIVDKRFLEILYSAFTADVDFTMCKFKFFSKKIILPQNREERNFEYISENDFWLRHFGGGNKPSCCNKIFKSYIFDRLRFKEGTTSEDEYIMHHITSRCKKVAFLNDELYFYRMRDSSITHSRQEKDVVRLKISILLDRCRLYFNTNNELLFEKFYMDCFNLLIKNYRTLSLKNERTELKKVYILKKQKYNEDSKRERLFFFNTRLFYLFVFLMKLFGIKI